MSEQVLVIGAGIGGLMTALSLSGTGRRIRLLERDSAPPADDPDEAFENWRRPGVSHMRQSHAFLARLRTIIRERQPALLEALKAEGVRELTLADMLTPHQRATYRPIPLDDELTIVTSRRTTLELVIRRHVESLPDVVITPDFRVERLVASRAADGIIDVTGVEGVSGDETILLEADLVVDTSGRRAAFIAQLEALGAKIPEESETAGILYFTRHYRLLPGVGEPSRTENPPASGDLGYLKFGVFPGDNGCFSITLAVPEIEQELRRAVLDPDKFHAITLMLPGLRPWTEAGRAEPRGKVQGMGDLSSHWRDMVVDGRPLVRGFFPLGDTLVRTNPLYGRGCSFAAVGAEALRKAIDSTRDPMLRQQRYHQLLAQELRPYFLNMRGQDRVAIKQARAALTPGHQDRLKVRLMRSFFDDGVRIALRKDVTLLREAMRGFHMLEAPNDWLKKPANLAKVLYHWSQGPKVNRAHYPPEPGPPRDELMRGLAIDARADVERVRARVPEPA